LVDEPYEPGSFNAATVQKGEASFGLEHFAARDFAINHFTSHAVCTVPSRYFLLSCLAIGLTTIVITDAFAQQSSYSSTQNSKPKTQVEQAARTRWQPTRGQSDVSVNGTNANAPSAVRQVAHQQATSGSIRRTQGSAELPAPVQPKPLPQSGSSRSMNSAPLMDLGVEGYEVPMPPQRSVMQRGPADSYMPMDGEVIYESHPYSGDLVSDTYGCDSMGCDSIGGSACGCGSSSCGSSSCVSGACGNGAWRPCLTLCFPQDGWVSVDYLNWRQKGMYLPPLVTTSRANTPQTDAGVLTRNATTLLFGDDEVLDNGFNGLRLNFGFWLDRCHNWGLGAEYFGIGQESVDFARTSTGAVGSQILARPFFNVGNTNAGEDAQLVAFPNVIRGTVAVRATSELAGAAVNLRYRTNCNTGCEHDWMCGGCSQVHTRADVLFGYRYLELDESVGISENLVSLLPAPDSGAFSINDTFDTRNTFNGFDMGMMYNRRRGVWTMDLLAKMALGNTRQVVNIRGTTLLDAAEQLPAGGLLAQQSNIGRHQRDRFAVVPELGATLGYHITPNFKLRAGYTFIYWSNVVRPGDQIDLDVNPEFLPPATGNITTSRRPRFAWNDSDYYVHGVNLGAEFTW
jgi:hypothetical protein